MVKGSRSLSNVSLSLLKVDFLDELFFTLNVSSESCTNHKLRSGEVSLVSTRPWYHGSRHTVHKLAMNIRTSSSPKLNTAVGAFFFGFFGLIRLGASTRYNGVAKGGQC